MQIKEKVKEKALAAFSEIKTEISDQFEELRADVARRFGEKRPEGEVFRTLPPPAGMEMSVLEALQNRRSQRNFSNEPLPDQLLSNILYAADGINRKGGRRTTATALNWRETDIYVLKPNGIWRWVPERHGVLFCSLNDVRESTYLLQTQLTVPPVELVYVANYARTRSLLTDAIESIAPKIRKAALTESEIREARLRACTLDVGIKLQSVYLAASAMGLACVARTGFRTDRISAALHLKSDEVVLAAQSLGFPAKSILDHLK